MFCGANRHYGRLCTTSASSCQLTHGWLVAISLIFLQCSLICKELLKSQACTTNRERSSAHSSFHTMVFIRKGALQLMRVQYIILWLGSLFSHCSRCQCLGSTPEVILWAACCQFSLTPFSLSEWHPLPPPPPWASLPWTSHWATSHTLEHD